MWGRICAATLVACALVAAGCGGDDDEGPSKADYIAKADAICKAGDAKIEAATSAISDPSDQAAVLEFVTATLIPNIEGQIKDLKALDKPKDDADTIDAIYADLDGALAKAKSDPSALLTAEGGASPFATANDKAKAYGMKVCGEDYGPRT